MAQQPAPVPTYTGAGSCSSGNCHGSVWPKTGGNINQNEYIVWSTKDRHAKAYAVLLEPRSKQIAANLKIARPEAETLCLNCHTTNAPTTQRASTFDASDGVGCESCHGVASPWLGSHFVRGWTHEQSVKVGMTDLKDTRVRPATCLSCHIGTRDKSVGHELLAAGHPDLIFELETFAALMPAHWRPASETTDTAHRWAVAQATALRDSMEQLRRRISNTSPDAFLDFADFECSSCHHALELPSRRQARGYFGKAGSPPWNESRYIIARQMIAAVSPSALTDLDARIAELKKSFDTPTAGHAQTSEAARRISESMNQLLPAIERATINPETVTRIIRAIVGDATSIGVAGMRSAEQATMSVDVLYNAIHPNQKEDPVNAQIELLYKLLGSQARYDPDQFAAALKKLATLL